MRIPPLDPGGVVDAVRGAVTGASEVVRPGAAVAVATSFGFPLALTLGVVLFLVIQGRFDRADPKLRSVPDGGPDATRAFENEDDL